MSVTKITAFKLQFQKLIHLFFWKLLVIKWKFIVELNQHILLYFCKMNELFKELVVVFWCNALDLLTEIFWCFIGKIYFILLYFWLHWDFFVAHGLSRPTPCGILVPQPETEPTSPALEGGFLTIGPPGRSLNKKSFLTHLDLKQWILKGLSTMSDSQLCQQ